MTTDWRSFDTAPRDYDGDGFGTVFIGWHTNNNVPVCMRWMNPEGAISVGNDYLINACDGDPLYPDQDELNWWTDAPQDAPQG